MSALSTQELAIRAPPRRSPVLGAPPQFDTNRTDRRCPRTPGWQQHARLNRRFLECPIVKDPVEATDEEMPNIGPTGRHQRHRGLLLALAVSWVVVPLVLGLLTSSALLG